MSSARDRAEVYADFDSVSALDPAEQRRLLTEGDPPERLWAAWALARACGVDVLPLFDRNGMSNASAGIRCHLIVVLAGLGSREVLPVLAVEEAAAEVRAAACAYFLRTAPSPVDEAARDFALKCLASERAELREAVLVEQQAGRLRLPEAHVISALADSNTEIRRLAVSCASAMVDSESAHAALVVAIATETDPDVRSTMLTAIPRSAYGRLLAHLAGGPTEQTARVLAWLRESRVELDGPELTAFPDTTEPSILAQLVALLPDRISDEAYTWLGSSFPHLGDNWRAFNQLRRGLPDRAHLLTTTAASHLRATLVARARVAEETLADDDDDLDDRDEWAEELLGLRRHVAVLTSRLEGAVSVGE